MFLAVWEAIPVRFQDTFYIVEMPLRNMMIYYRPPIATKFVALTALQNLTDTVNTICTHYFIE